MSKRLGWRPFVFAGGLFVLTFYQNCSQAPDTTNDSQSTYQSQLPFAYKAKLDTIAYMSCSEITDLSYQPRAYFTFRAGAYNSATGGLSMTPSFLSSTQYYSNTDRANVLAASDYNSSAMLSLSVRSTSNYQQVWGIQGESGAGFDLDAFLPPLDSSAVAGPFASLQSGQQMNYFPGPGDQRLMEASLRFLTYENLAAQNRNNLGSGTTMLVAGYSKSTDTTDASLRSPLDVTISGTTYSSSQTTANTVFGIGYKLNFDFPVGRSQGDRRVLSSVGIQALDLTTNQVISSAWSCPTSFQFMIVRPEDVGTSGVTCNLGVDRYTTQAQQSALNAIRRVLRVEDWYVDLVNQCVVPKLTGDYCYGSTLGTRTIEYATQCTDTTTTYCPHYVSVCISQ